MDDFERDMLCFELDQEAKEFDIEYAAELAKNPEWWNIAHGLKEASRKEYDKSKEILSKFLRFQPQGISCFFERVKLFEQAMLTNSIK